MKRKSWIMTALWLLGAAPISQAASDGYWGFCNGDKAFVDAGFTVPKPQADWVCKAPVASSTGEAKMDNTQRCVNSQGRECQVGQGGVGGAPGDHNVPGTAWYWAPGTNSTYPDIRCQCGCFTPDVLVLTTKGYQAIGDLSQKASSDLPRIGTFGAADGGLQASEALVNKDFTVGPEEKAVYVITAGNGTKLTLTEVHPVVVVRDGRNQMVAAANLAVGDKLLDVDGRSVDITSIDRHKLPAVHNKVYNLDTKGKTPEQHVILANGLRVGDVVWQRALSEKEARIDNILYFGSEHL